MSEDVDMKDGLEQLARFKAMGEKAYDDMYEAHSSSDATACYSNAKECYYDAIGLANRLGLKEEAEALNARLRTSKRSFGINLATEYGSLGPNELAQGDVGGAAAGGRRRTEMTPGRCCRSQSGGR